MILENMVVALKADMSDFKNKMGQASSEAENFNSKMGSVFSKVATTIAGAFTISKVTEFFSQSISAASDLNETMSKSEAVFGSANRAIVEMGNNAAQSLGMTKNEAISAAATYGNLFRSMGITEQASANMSTSLVKLAGDLASFNNMDVSTVLEKLRSGLTGETEPLKSLGVNINQAGIEAEALKLKLWDGVGAINASAKAQASLSLILQQTSLAQGDFARTSGGAANQQRILTAQMENLKAEIGTGLLPAFVDLLKTLNSVVVAFNQLREINSKYTNTLKLHNEELRNSGISYEAYRTEMERAAKSAGWLVDAEGRVFQVRRDGVRVVKEYSTEIVIATRAEYEYGNAVNNSKNAGAMYTAIAADMAEKTKLAGQAATGSAAMYTAMAQAFSDQKFKTAQEQIGLITASMGELTTATLYQKAIIGMDADAALQLGVQLGLVSGASYDAQSQILAWQKELAAGKITVEEYSKLVAGLVGWWNSFGDKTITLTVNTKGIPDPYDLKDPSGFYTPTPVISPGGKEGDGSGQAKSLGGSVYSGSSYLVGETGPELFVPGTNGAITPNSQLGDNTEIINLLKQIVNKLNAMPGEIALVTRDAILQVTG